MAKSQTGRVRPKDSVLRSVFRLLANHFHEHAFRSATIEFPVKDLFPRSEVELPLGDCHHDFASHDLPLVVRVGIVFARPVMVIPF